MLGFGVVVYGMLLGAPACMWICLRSTITILGPVHLHDEVQPRPVPDGLQGGGQGLYV